MEKAVALVTNAARLMVTRFSHSACSCLREVPPGKLNVPGWTFWHDGKKESTRGHTIESGDSVYGFMAA